MRGLVREDERHLQAIEQQARQAAEELQALRGQLEEMRRELQTAREESEALKDQSRQAVEDFELAAQYLSSAREDARATRQQVQETERSLRAASEREQQGGDRYERAEEAGQDPEQAGVPAGRVDWPALPEVLTPEPVTPAEGARDRLVRYLNDAWAVEKALGETLQNMADKVADPGLRALLQGHREVTHGQQQSLEERLRALGKEPSDGKGFFDQMLTRIWDAVSRPRDRADHTLHDLLKVIGTGCFQIALYRALEAYARAVGDDETALLAGEHLRQEQAGIDRIYPSLGPTVAQAVSSPEPG